MAGTRDQLAERIANLEKEVQQIKFLIGRPNNKNHKVATRSDFAVYDFSKDRYPEEYYTETVDGKEGM